MPKHIILAIIIALACVNIASAVTIMPGLNVVPDRDSFIQDGRLSLTIRVKNPNTDISITGVLINASATGSLVVSPASRTISSIAPGKSSDVALTITGDVEGSETLTIKVIEGTCGDECEVRATSLNIELRQPRREISIVGPKKEITWVVEDKTQPATVSFDALLRNTGEVELKEVTITGEFNEEQLSCKFDSKKISIPAGQTGKLSVSCENVSTGKRMMFYVEDKTGEAWDRETLEFKLAEPFRLNEMRIISPVENAEFRLGEFGGHITVLVENSGDAGLSGVCTRVENMQFTSDGCADLAVGANHSFRLNIIPESNITNAYIVASDSENKTDASVTVRIIKIAALRPPINDTPVINDSVPDEPEVPDEVEEEEEEFSFPMEILVILIILIPVIILVVYIKKSVARAE
jgi:hypothetical protein